MSGPYSHNEDEENTSYNSEGSGTYEEEDEDE